MSSFRCGCERGEVVSGGRRSSSWWRRSGWRASSARSNWWCGCTLARRRERGRESWPPGGASMAASAVPAVPSSVCFRSVFVVVSSLPCLGSLLLAACGPPRRCPFRVERSRRGIGCRPVGQRRNGAAFARSRPFSQESSPASGFSTGSVDGQTARPSGEAIGAERRRVENSRRRPSAAASTRASYGAGSVHLAAVLERDALGGFAGGTISWGRGAFHVGWTGALGPGTVRPCPRGALDTKIDTVAQALGAIAKDVSFPAGRQAERDRTTGR